jgi:hypothetical protein
LLLASLLEVILLDLLYDSYSETWTLVVARVEEEVMACLIPILTWMILVIARMMVYL